jgi:hypothetical protein
MPVTAVRDGLSPKLTQHRITIGWITEYIRAGQIVDGFEE